MKILVLHTAYRQKGGEDFVVEAERQLLEAHGHRVFLLPFTNPTNQLHALWLFLLSIFNPFSYYQTRRAIRAFQPDAVHIHNWHFAASPAVFIAARWARVPVVCTLHNYRLLCPSGILLHNGQLFLDSLGQSFPWSAVGKKVYRNSFWQTFWLALVVWLHRKFGTWRGVDRYIALTEFSRKIFLRSNLGLAAKQIVVKPNFVEDSPLDAEEKDNAFLFIGRLSQEKGIATLLTAFAQSGLPLNIGGDGPLREEVETACLHCPNIRFLGRLSREEVLQQMSASLVLIFPSICYETFGLTIIEAFSRGLPVIAARLGAITAMIDDGRNGLLFEAGNADDLVEKTRRVITMTEAEKTAFSSHARQTYLDYYTPEKNLAQLTGIYQSVIDEKTQSHQS
jgi:glycosyltransferase involved in cell wall biosynthesis